MGSLTLDVCSPPDEATRFAQTLAFGSPGSHLLADPVVPYAKSSPRTGLSLIIAWTVPSQNRRLRRVQSQNRSCRTLTVGEVAVGVLTVGEVTCQRLTA